MIKYKLTYLKTGSGKYYTGSEYWANNLEDAVREVRLLREKRLLPGLSPGHSEHDVIVETPEGLPHLITVEPKVVSVTRTHLEELKRQAEHYPRVAGLNTRLSNVLQRWLDKYGYAAPPFLERETREALGDVDLRDTIAAVEGPPQHASCRCVTGAPDVARKPEGAPPSCPKCGVPMILETNRTTLRAFWGCSKFPECNGSRDWPRYWEDRGKSLPASALPSRPLPNLLAFFRASIEECHLLISRDSATFQTRSDWDATTLPSRVLKLLGELREARNLAALRKNLLKDFKHEVDRKRGELRAANLAKYHLTEELRLLRAQLEEVSNEGTRLRQRDREEIRDLEIEAHRQEIRDLEIEAHRQAEIALRAKLQTETQVARDLRAELEGRGEIAVLRKQLDWFKDELHQAKLRLSRALLAQENFRKNNDNLFVRTIEVGAVLREVYRSRVLRSLLGTNLLKDVKRVLDIAPGDRR